MKATGMEDNSEAKPLAQIERHSYSEVGWISRQNLLAFRSRENFFLDIPFYRAGRGKLQEWKTTQKQTLSRKSRGTLTVKWAGSRNKIFSPSGRGRTFFLTSLFIELIDRGREGIRNNGRLLRRGSGPPTL